MTSGSRRREGPAVVVEGQHIDEGGTGVRVSVEAPGRHPLLALPSFPTPFVGRTEQLAALDKALNEEDREVVMLRGPSGVGKTRIAVEHAAARRSSYPDGVYFLRCEVMPPLDLAIVASALDLPVIEGERPEERWRRALYAIALRKALLVYDNVESIDAMRAWLPPRGSSCRAIVTSTVGASPAWLRSIDVPALPDEDARTLVAELIADPKAVDAYGEGIVKRAAGVTMELCALAEWVDEASQYGQKVAAIEKGLTAQTRSSLEGPWRGLHEDARLLLRVACLFEPSRVPEEDLRGLFEVAGWDAPRFEGALLAARKRTLITVAGEVLRVHSLVAEIVREQVEPALPEGFVERHFGRFALAAVAFGERPSDASRSARFFAYPTSLDAWEALGPGIVSELGRHGISIGGALFEGGRVGEAQHWYERAVAASKNGDARGRINHERLGRDLHNVGICHFSEGRFDEARVWFERAVREKEKGDAHGRVDPESLGMSLHQVGMCHSREGRFSEARVWLKRAVKEKEKGDVHGRVDPASLGVSLHQVGICHFREKRFEEALGWFERAVKEAEKTDVHGLVNPASLGGSLHQVGMCHFLEGRFGQARVWFERAVISEEKGDVHGRVDPDSLGRSLHQVGMCHFCEGRFEEAQGWLKRAVKEREKGDMHGRIDPENIAISQVALADIHRALDQPRKA